MSHLLLLHGAIGAKDQLEALADCLKEKYTVHIFNFSGHGGEPIPAEDFSIPLFSNDVLNYMQQHQIEQASVLGYSMGGYVAMHLAKYQPQRIQKLITLATKFYWDESVAAKEALMLDANVIAEKVPAFAAVLEKRHAPADWKRVLEKTKDMLLQLGRSNALQLEDYTTIAAPCLLLLGDKDKMVTVEETLQVQQMLPHGFYQQLPQTPHPIEQVSMQMLAAMAEEFLSTEKQGWG